MKRNPDEALSQRPRDVIAVFPRIRDGPKGARSAVLRR